MTYYTSPDRLPAPDDYSQPADTPTVLQELANAVQAALGKRAAAATIHPTASAPWAMYWPITAVDPSWDQVGPWGQTSNPSPGVFEIVCQSYMEVRGGTANEVAAFSSVAVQWSDGSAAQLVGGMPVQLGRLTVPANTRIVQSAVTRAFVVNTGHALMVRPMGCVSASVAGSSYSLGRSRVTVMHWPDMVIGGAVS